MGGNYLTFVEQEYQADLKAHCGWEKIDQVKWINKMGQVGFNGMGFALMVVNKGLGPRFLFLHAAALLCTGALWYTSLLNVGGDSNSASSKCAAYTQMALAFCCITQGSAGLFQGALFYTMANAAKTKVGLLCGLLQTTNGLAPIFWLAVYKSSFIGRDIQKFFNTCGAVWVGTAVLAYFLLTAPTPTADTSGSAAGPGAGFAGA